MNEKGQVLVSILIIIAVATLSIGAAIVSASLSKTSAVSSQSDRLLYSAESGAEEALLRLLRNPNYSGETLNLEGISVEVEVSTSPMQPNSRQILSTAYGNNLSREVEVLVNFTDNILTVTSWKNTP